LIALCRKKSKSFRSIDAILQELWNKNANVEQEPNAGTAALGCSPERSSEPVSIQGTRHFWLSQESSTAG
jgi:hypothetical protein